MTFEYFLEIICSMYCFDFYVIQTAGFWVPLMFVDLGLQILNFIFWFSVFEFICLFFPWRLSIWVYKSWIYFMLSCFEFFCLFVPLASLLCLFLWYFTEFTFFEMSPTNMFLNSEHDLSWFENCFCKLWHKPWFPHINLSS